MLGERGLIREGSGGLFERGAGAYLREGLYRGFAVIKNLRRKSTQEGILKGIWEKLLVLDISTETGF